MKTLTAALAVLATLALTGCDDSGSDPGYCQGHPNNTSVCKEATR